MSEINLPIKLKHYLNYLITPSIEGHLLGDGQVQNNDL